MVTQEKIYDAIKTDIEALADRLQSNKDYYSLSRLLREEREIFEKETFARKYDFISAEQFDYLDKKLRDTIAIFH